MLRVWLLVVARWIGCGCFCSAYLHCGLVILRCGCGYGLIREVLVRIRLLRSFSDGYLSKVVGELVLLQYLKQQQKVRAVR